VLSWLMLLQSLLGQKISGKTIKQHHQATCCSGFSPLQSRPAAAATGLNLQQAQQQQEQPKLESAPQPVRGTPASRLLIILVPLQPMPPSINQQMQRPSRESIVKVQLVPAGLGEPHVGALLCLHARVSQ
jgi:hypothetical protein